MSWLFEWTSEAVAAAPVTPPATQIDPGTIQWDTAPAALAASPTPVPQIDPNTIQWDAAPTGPRLLDAIESVLWYPWFLAALLPLAFLGGVALAHRRFARLPIQSAKRRTTVRAFFSASWHKIAGALLVSGAVAICLDYIQHFLKAMIDPWNHNHVSYVPIFFATLMLFAARAIWR